MGSQICFSFSFFSTWHLARAYRDAILIHACMVDSMSIGATFFFFFPFQKMCSSSGFYSPPSSLFLACSLHFPATTRKIKKKIGKFSKPLSFEVPSADLIGPKTASPTNLPRTCTTSLSSTLFELASHLCRVWWHVLPCFQQLFHRSPCPYPKYVLAL